jgi:ASC-1-like (ASCH) protein
MMRLATKQTKGGKAMTVEQIFYDEARKQMKPGDVIALGGKGNFSEIIKFAPFADVSHVGVIFQTKVVEDDTDRFFNLMTSSLNWTT